MSAMTFLGDSGVPGDPRWAQRLSVGTHLTPRHGACLMELVSRAAGEKWSDGPPCTHQGLAHLARLVNDATGDETRQALVTRVPALVASGPASAETTAEMAFECATYSLARHGSPILAHFQNVARWRIRLARSQGLTSPLLSKMYDHGPAMRTLEASVLNLLRLPLPSRDEHLVGLLDHAIGVIGRGTRPPSREPQPTAR
jgi:hypothetical protein